MKRFKRGLDPRGKSVAPAFLQPHRETPSLSILEQGPQTNVKSSVYRPAWGFRKQDSVMSSLPHSVDWSLNAITPPDYKDWVSGGSLDNNEQMGSQAFYSANAHFQGVLHKAKAWKLEAKKMEEKFKKMEISRDEALEMNKKQGEELATASAELVRLRASKEEMIDEYMDSEEFQVLMRRHDKDLFPDIYTEGWNGALDAISEKHPGMIQHQDFPSLYPPIVPMEEDNAEEDNAEEDNAEGYDERILDPLNASPVRGAAPSGAFTVSHSAAGDAEEISKKT